MPHPCGKTPRRFGRRGTAGAERKALVGMERIDKVTGTFEKRCTENGAKEGVSSAVKSRLPRYHRYLGELLAQDKLRISSAELSRLMGVTASQIRQDLNCFGGFGQQGYGYNVKYLHQKIGELLGVEEGYRAVIVGAGNLGRALVASPMFARRGVERVAMFDVDPALIGTVVEGLPVRPAEELVPYCRANGIHIGVLTTPRFAAAEMAEKMADAGILGIWNFSNVELDLRGRQVIVENIHMGDSLMKLCFAIKSREDGEEEQ